MDGVSSTTLTPDDIPPPPLPPGHMVVMTISWISFIIYVDLLYIILVKKKTNSILNSSVYSILLYNSIGDICMFFHSELIMRPRKYRFFGLFGAETPVWIAYYSYFAMSHLRIVMILSYIPLAANRFTAFALPLVYKKMWKPGNVAMITVIVWVSSCILSLLIFTAWRTVLSFKILDNGVLQIIAGDLFLRDAIEVAVISLVSCLICVFLYMGGVIFAKKDQRTSVLERKLFICSLLASIPLLIESCKAWYLLFGVMKNSEDIVLFVAELWFYWTEIMTSIQCWSILLITPSARRLIIEEGLLGIAFRKRSQVRVIVTQHTSTTMNQWQ